MKIVALLFLIVFTPVSFAQSKWWKAEEETTNEKVPHEENENSEEEKEIKKGKVTVTKSPSIEKVIKFKSSTIPPYSGAVQDGYRIQLFFDQDRSEVDKARNTVLSSDNELPTYVEYQAPNYLLLLGDFRTRLEAEKVRAQMAMDFPAAIIKEDKIYMPIIKEEEITND